ncbi:hypothetical protein HFU87_09880 [Acidithiobacillus sp. CV18-3]|nr:hypothetical protein [Acidithiobacillus sp. CV18-3]MBU2757487.1 hypothetical protein [Acidithiobacillus sp. BN09-2]
MRAQILEDDDQFGVWRPDLECCLVSLEYHAAAHTGILRLPHLNCTDMSGAIKLFAAIDPDVETIFTFQCGEQAEDCDIPDTAYSRRGSGKWFAIPCATMRERFAAAGGGPWKI